MAAVSRLIGPFLRHGSNLPILGGLAALVLRFALAPATFAPLLVLVGALVFGVTEYTTHRFLLHAPPQGSAALRRFQERLHHDHHVEPNRLDLLFLPWWFAIPAAALYAGIYAAVTRGTGPTLSLLLGTIVALAFYEWVHYVAHVPFVPKTRYGRWIKKYHLRHHFLNERYWFGVTNPSMDVAGRTLARVAEVERAAP